MKKIILVAAAVAAAIIVGILLGRSMDSTSQTVAAPAAGSDREVLYWVAPMDANFRRDEPGKSPMGMDLVPVYADQVDGQPGVVSIDATTVNNLGVRTARAQRGELSQRIETVGYVGYDEDTVQHVHTRVDGWIEKLATKAKGDPVKRGQLLFELYSPTLVNAQEEYLVALRSGNKLLLQASKERLAALGVTASEIARLDKERTVRQRVRVYAEVDGVITHLGVREGIYVTPANEIMSVAQLDKVWVLAEVFERQAAWVKPDQSAVVELDYLPATTFLGSVDYVYPELDPKTRTLRVRIRFDNTAETLRPNMFARVTIQGDSTGEVVHVPREALIRGGSTDRVVVALGGGRFRAQAVETGIESGDRVAIRKGISAGELVVVSGQFLIDSESNIDAALSRMDPAPQESTQ
ncbi:MAG: efflux RND transporter periplasmic adaptor subunit [Gammaproteobacteria bacterium]|nr:efflux RND transporter periplasmic adaptor subunit [Gammaproteobacteria bacterium]MBT8111828.1 efflux RND transporter periplasmic adaptor subunit [Gammaproteobacteria bacterium]NNL46527.1 efflux RND transporter periplasmic adaptor subunit [Woeseiaceae bacterium]